MQGLTQGLREGIRMPLRAPGLTLVAITTLALGIGASTSIFSVVNAAVLRNLPYGNIDQLVMFYFTDPMGEESWYSTPAAYRNLANRNTVFTDVAAWGNDTWPANMTGHGDPQRLLGFQVSANFFQVLGVSAARGRTFLAEEDRPGSTRVVIISDEFWRREFGSDPDIIGRSITLNGVGHDVVGVMPADLRFLLKTDIWTTLAFARPDENLHQVARLKPGARMERVRSEVEQLLVPYIKDPRQQLQANVKPLQTVLMGYARDPLFTLYAAISFVLLIACVNVANLLLVRGSTRRKELAIRAALGAGRRGLITQLLAESAVLAFIGGACGLLVASWCTHILVGGLPDWLALKNSRVAMLRIDGWAVAYTFGISLLTTFICGLVPALGASKLNLSDALQEGGRAQTGGLSQNRIRSSLVVAEVALAMVSLTGSGLMIKSFWRLSNTNRGFDTTGVLTAQIDPSPDRYRKASDLVSFYQRLLERLSVVPGMRYAGLVNSWDRGWRVAIEEHPAVPQEDKPVASIHPASPDYFRAMGIPLMAGRFFTDRDVSGAAPVAIIDAATAKRDFAGEDPIGKHLQFPDKSREIVGVVGATKAWKRFSFDGDDDPPFPNVYVPYQQDTGAGSTISSTMMVIVRAESGDPMNLIGSVRKTLAAQDPEQPIHSFKTLEQSSDELRADRHFSTLLMATLGGLATLLAALGIYGVMSFTTTQRTREIGIRMALGAGRRDIARTTITHGLVLISTGLATGAVGSILLSRYIKTMLFGVAPVDPFTYCAVCVLLAAVALLACYVPSRRATKIDPIIALRRE